MITETDSLSTIELDKYYVIVPTTPKWTPQEYLEVFKGKMVEPGFKYNSGTNEDWMTPERIREEIRLHVDPNFTI